MLTGFLMILADRIAIGRIITSKIPGAEGPCFAIWTNQHKGIVRRYGGCTGYFRKAIVLLPGVAWLSGEEFYGLIRDVDPSSVVRVPGDTSSAPSLPVPSHD